MNKRARENSSPEKKKPVVRTGSKGRKVEVSMKLREKTIASKPQFTTDSADKELALAVAGGDVRAWRILYERWSGELERYGRSCGWDSEFVGDLVQDTMIRAWDNRCSYDPKYPYRVWVLTIFRRLTASAYRRRKIHDRVTEGGSSDEWWAEGVGSMAGALGESDIREVLEPVLAKLRPEDQRLLTLWSESRCQADLARKAGIKPVTLRTQVLRARTKLRKAFLDMYPETARLGWDGNGEDE